MSLRRPLYNNNGVLQEIGSSDTITGLPFTQTIVDFGISAVDSMEFTINDANCLSTSNIICSMAYMDTVDNTADEIEVSKVSCSAGQASDGSFVLNVMANEGPISGHFAVNYLLI